MEHIIVSIAAYVLMIVLFGLGVVVGMWIQQSKELDRLHKWINKNKREEQ